MQYGVMLLYRIRKRAPHKAAWPDIPFRSIFLSCVCCQDKMDNSLRDQDQFYSGFKFDVENNKLKK